MAGFPIQENDPSLSELYIECIKSIGIFLMALSEENCRVIWLEQVHLQGILEEYGRMKIWGDLIKAFLPARARGSLNDTLRHDSGLKHSVELHTTKSARPPR